MFADSIGNIQYVQDKDTLHIGVQFYYEDICKSVRTVHVHVQCMSEMVQGHTVGSLVTSHYKEVLMYIQYMSICI